MKKQPKVSRKERWRRKQAANAETNRAIELVRKYLARHQPDRFKLVVSTDAVLRRGEYWYLVVRPDDEGVSLLTYESRLGRTEDEIQREEGVKVMLLPLLPPEDEMELEMPVLWALREYETEVICPAGDAGKKERETDHG